MLLKEKKLVLCITNSVTINQVANTVLATGASPVMSNDKHDASKLLEYASALVINIGTINTHQEDIIDFLLAKNKNQVPIILDPVGAGATSYRHAVAKKILDSNQVRVIKGNASEIKSLLDSDQAGLGVDANSADYDYQNAKQLAKKYRCVVLMTGANDVVADKTGETIIVKGGHANVGLKTGIGCMLAGMVGALTTQYDYFEAARKSAEIFKKIGAQFAKNFLSYEDFYEQILNS